MWPDWRSFMKTKSYFPMFIDLSDKNVVVVGGGNIATRRVKTLLQFTRNVTAIAPKVTEELRGLGTAGYVNLITRPVKRSDFQTAYMVIAATNDWKLNDEIYRVCKEEGIYVNILYDPKTLLITTGISYKNFSLDKSLEYAFDEYLAKFLKEKAAL